MRELERVLAPGGWLYADFLDLDDSEYGKGNIVEQHTFRGSDGVEIHFSDQAEIEALFSQFTITHLAKVQLGTKLPPRVAWTVWAQREN